MVAFGALVVWSREIWVGGFGWSDAPRHALDGAFLLDAARAMPVGHFGEWAREYAARYPTLGIFGLYPPFFAGVEAVFYAALGVSVLASRLTVAAFGLGGLLAMYWVGRQLFDYRAGILAAGLWGTLPTTVLWAREAVLEVPAVTMLLVCLGGYLQYRSTGRRGWLAVTAASLTAAALTRQGTVVFGLVLMIDLVWALGWKKTMTARAAAVFAAAGAVIGLNLLFVPGSSAAGAGWRGLLTLENWLFYGRTMPELVGGAMLGFAGVGFLICTSVGKLKTIRLPLLWLVVFYVFASTLPSKSPRSFYLVTPAVVLAAVGGLYQALERTPLKTPGRAILAAVLVVQFAFGWRQDPERLNDYGGAVRAILHRGDAGVVLVDAVRDGQFVFDMRREQGARGRVQTICAGAIVRPEWREKEILAMLRGRGVRYVVLETNAPVASDWHDGYGGMESRPCPMLRKAVYGSGGFEKIASFPVGDSAAWKDARLEVFRCRGAQRP